MFEPSRPMLVGRAREEAALGKALSDALQGRGSLVLISGEAGIGKTVLAEALCRDAAKSGALTLTGGCYELIETPPYGPWIELFGGYPADPALPVIPAIVARCGTEGGIGSPDALLVSVGAFLSEVACTRPLILFLDDLQWSDRASLDILRGIARQAAALPIIILVTYRGNELGPQRPLFHYLPTLVREARPTRLALNPLTSEDIWGLVRDRFRLAVADEARLADYLFNRAEGHPFFTSEVLHTLIESGVLRVTTSGWQLGDLTATTVPELVGQLIGGRLANLGDRARRTLDIAATIGQEVPFDLWCSVSGVSEDALLELVDQAVGQRLVQELSDGLRLRFTHAIIRHAIYEGISPSRRRQWHLRVGEALAEASSDPDAIAYHFQQAHDPRAVEWLIKAGERAQRAYSWLVAAERFESALSLLDEVDPEFGWLLVRVAVLRRYVDHDGGIRRLEAARAWGARHGNRPLTVFAGLLQGLLRCYARDYRRGLSEMLAGEAEMNKLPEQDLASLSALGGELGVSATDVSGLLALWLASAGRYADARAAAERALSMPASDQVSAAIVSRGASGSIAYGDAYAGLFRAAAAAGNPAEAWEAFERAIEHYRAAGHQSQLARTIVGGFSMVFLTYFADDPTEGQRLIAAAEDALTYAGGMVEGPVPSRGVRLGLLSVQGNWSEIAEVAREFRSAGRAQGSYTSYAAMVLGLVAHRQGDAALASRLVRELLPAGPAEEPGNGVYFYAQVLQRLAVKLALDAGNFDEAREWLEAHDRWLAWSGSVLGRAEGAFVWALYHRATDEIGLAHQQAAQSLAQARDPYQPLALLPALRLLGELATAEQRFDEAEAHLTEALSLAEACAAAYERALTLLALAELRAAAGGSDALQLAEEAAGELDRLSASVARSRAAELVARLATDTDRPSSAASPPSPTGANPAGLTRRELEVLRLLARGHTNQEIADALFLSAKTVENHVTRILAKTGSPNRAAAAAFAQRQQLL